MSVALETGMSRTTTALIFLAALAAVAANAAPAVAPAAATGAGSMSIVIPAISGVRIAHDPRSQQPGQTPVLISVFASSAEVVVQRYAAEQPSHVLLVSDISAHSNAIAIRNGGWVNLTDRVEAAPQRTSSKSAPRPDVTYEIWSF
jgi:hypothetical protein